MSLRERHSFCIANAQKHSIFVISIRLTSALNRTSGSSKTLCSMRPVKIPKTILRQTISFSVSKKVRADKNRVSQKQFRELETVFSFYFPLLFFGFRKPVLAIPNLAHLFFAKGCKKPNKLNYLPTKKVCFQHFVCACA